MPSSTPKTVDTPPPVETVDASPNQRPAVRIRTYHVDDLKTIHVLFTAGFMYYASLPSFGDIPMDFVVQQIQEHVDDDLSKIEEVYFGSGGHFWVATTEEDGKETIVGMVGLEDKPNKEGELRRMSVHQDYRRNGVGRLLMSTLENWAKDNEMVKVWLSTGAVMTLANKFYLSVGYSVTKTEVYSQEPRVEAVFYEKLLK